MFYGHIRRILNSVAAVLFASTWLFSQAKADTVTVFAAASLKTALDAVKPAFEQTSTHHLVISYAGSSVLARQIELGAPAQVYIPANPNWMDYLQQAHLIIPDSRHNLLGNRLVLVAPATENSPEIDLHSPGSIAAVLGQGKLAMGLTNAVPAGIYGKAALESFGQWEGLLGQIAQTDNVRASLALVASGEAPLGIVYATDAMADPRVKVVAQFPGTSHPPILYPVALVAPHPGPPAQDFLTFLFTPPAADIFSAQGFSLVEE